MTISDEDRTTVELDYFSEETNEHFDEVMAEVRERTPIVNASGTWLLTRHEHVREAANDWETFSSARGTMPWSEDGAHFRPSALDPPLHTQFRKPFEKVFAPRQVNPLVPMMRGEARALIAKIREQGSCDLGPEYARAYIANTFFKGILGLSAEVAPKMMRLIDGWLLPPFDDDALVEYNRYGAQLLAEKLDDPGPRTPTMEAILSLEVDGEPAAWIDKCNLLSQLIVGGLDTSATSTTRSLLYLATHPELLAELVADPSLIPAAVEEFIRRFPANLGNGRMVMRDIVLHGQKLKRGDRVMLGFGVAAQDPRQFEDPLDVDIHRPAQSHIVFGAGIHRCLGSHFARLEIAVAVEEFITAFPHFTLDPESELHFLTGMTREVSGARIIVE